MRFRRGRDTDESFTAFVATRSHRLIAHAELLCGHREQARDIVQSVLTRAYLRWSRIEHDDPYGYVQRSVTNAVTDWWRTGHQRHERPVDVVPDAPAGPDNALEDRRSLLAALDLLTGRERAVVVLRYFDDHTERDVAKILGISVGTVKSTCHTALRKMRIALDDEVRGPRPSHGTQEQS
ncbi:DNA-directed RNA polymerase sigma-70 factor [Paractinoplanes abujensis]|uniref:RNA polymerase sigma-70 factor (Sigma-E family) n=1 Tax=Paractinoplanes abujensis TaxID=882441 RepID=A0A7W7CRU0_9ACTN|nr:SigE family RNA polymerase sigma factor [Actinoplanes abujensis]MBB4693199.1 RNA polymerase sigma-70 factor (sigma-E family) [Actinoplanes abujensis]GID24398.1 DNA-directed RNA polymerase sigma-70 factor [Actinoplanes abujensis]